MHFLSSLDLPGNVRQLENLCNWITVMAPGQTVEIKDLPPELIEGSGAAMAGAAMHSAAMAGSAMPVNAMPLSSPAPSAAMPSSFGYNGDAMPVREATAPVMVGAPQERSNWVSMLEAEAAQMLSAGQPEVMDALGRMFESALIKTALKHTHGRKNDAAIRLGIGRNTITRKIQELGIEGGKDD